MRQATSQEPVSDSGHSLILESSESNGANSLKSAAMLGIALSVGASGALIPQTEAAAAVTTPTTPATTEAFSSDFQAEPQTAADTATQQIATNHTVEVGESLWQIAQQHRVGLQELKSANALAPETSISVGQVLKVPATAQSVTDAQTHLALADTASEVDAADAEEAPSALLEMTVTPSVETADASVPSAQTDASESSTAPVVTAYAPTPTTSNYRVQAGDTIRSIASSLGSTPEEIVRANRLIDPNVIFVGSTLVVPVQQPVAQPAPAAKVSQPEPETEVRAQSDRPQRSATERLAYLRDTAASPDASRILSEIRQSTPEAPVSVGGEKVTEQDVLSAEENSTERLEADNAEGADPVANLMEDVQDMQEQSVQVTEADSVEIESDAVLSEAARPTSRLLARANASDRISRLNVAGMGQDSTETSESAESESVTEVAEADSDLLAAAPLSPDAYIPAQRSSTGQVVSPDMPILPEADEYLPEAPDYFDGYMWPTQGTVTSGYGWRWGRMHRGVDVAGPVGTPIVAAAAGVVEKAGWNSGGYGNLVEIRHPDGSLTRYAHNNSLSVSAGQSVRQGQQIAEMGSTGYSTGPHLHFEVYQGGSAVNPVAYLPNR